MYDKDTITLDESFYIDESEQVSQNTNTKFRDSYFKSEESINNFVDKLDILQEEFNAIYNELKDGSLSKDLTSERRDILIKKLENNKDEIALISQDTLNQLSKDITKLNSLKVNSNVNLDVFNDLKRKKSDDDGLFVD
ncbi:hypothetical protein KJJ36_14010 [Staphylococcus pseudoxylosus]|uniref:hypothetical protein n=1 Tax=Staphylococcus pseudoxylosus TaxID=2282419 RepID=UPI001F247E54|nr:hypothetical protein [Staphylococcus pseudoxylosus]MCE5003482.1 hypothetical protein [Staphylococcus pseudoxylosus]